MPEPTRLFVGNLPSGVSESDLSKEFSFYGIVKNVELKQKKVAAGEDNSIFAFVTLESDIQSVNKCVNEFKEQKWKGSFLNVSVARESFMEKLKREREEEERRKQNQGQPNYTQNDQNKEISLNIPFKPSVKIAPRPVTINGNCTNGDSSYSDSPKAKDRNYKTLEIEETEYVESSYNAEEYKEPENKSFEVDASISTNDIPVKIVKLKRNKIKQDPWPVKRKIKIESVVKVSEPVKPQEVKTLTAADEKRLKSMQNMRSAYNEKKSLIKIALSSVDKKINKIVFNDDGDAIPNNEVSKETSSNASNKRKHQDEKSNVGKVNFEVKKGKKSLFDENDSDDEEDNINFDVKEQFQGESGQKLMQLQSRFQSDKRFAMDERFMEDPPNDSEDKPEARDDKIDSIEDDERLRQMEILQGILGTTVRTSSHFPVQKDGEPSKKQLPIKTMLRYDPSRPEHDKFMSKPATSADGPAKKSKKERKKERLMALTAAQEKTDEKPVPEVSQERYYKVNESLKQTMEEQQPFSLLSLFGNREPEDNEASKADAEYHAQAINKSNDKFANPLKASNPFVYDSESDDDDNKKAEEQKVKEEESPYGPAQPKALLVTENFFFSNTDPRFKEGLDFFLNSTVRSKSSREELKFLVKRRIQNNIRNERTPFKKVQQRHPAKTTKFKKR